MAYSVQVGDFDAMHREWEELLPFSCTNTVFVTPWWQRIWWNRFGRNWDLCITSIREDGTMLGIAPLMWSDGVVRFVGDTDLFDYLDFLVPETSPERFYTALFDHLSTLNWHTLDLMSVPPKSPTLSYLPEVAKSMGMSIEVVEEDMAPVASLPSTWDEYQAGLAKKDRHELRRKLRRLEQAGNAHQYTLTTREDLASCMHEFFRLLRASGPEKAEFLTPERESFFTDIALEMAGRDQFRLYFLEVNGTRVASCICFDYDGSYLLYNSGYDPAYSPLSVGFLNKALCVKEAIELGRHTFEFLRGSERYKYDLGGKDQAIYHLTVRR